MGAFRISMKGLVLVLLLAGLALGAMVTTSELYSAALFSLTLLVLCSALSMAVYVRGTRRAFWVGFAAAGWLYLVLMRGLESDGFRQSTIEYHLASAVRPLLQRPVTQPASQAMARQRDVAMQGA